MIWSWQCSGFYPVLLQVVTAGHGEGRDQHSEVQGTFDQGRVFLLYEKEWNVCSSDLGESSLELSVEHLRKIL